MEKWKLRFWSIFLGQALSQVGSAVTQFVLLWWITTTTGQISSLATAGIAALLPQALLGPIGGICADRYSRRLIMIVCDLISALCIVALIFLFTFEAVELWHVYTLMFVRSCMQAFQGPASQASTAMLVPASFLPRAAGLNQTTLSLMIIAAAPTGALAIGAFGIQGALFIDVVTALMGIVPLLFYRVPQPARAEVHSSPLADFKKGLKLVWHTKGLRHLFYLQGTAILVLMPCFTLVPLLITTHFKGTVNDVALFEGLSGVGMLAGAAAITWLNPKRRALTYILGFTFSCAAVGFTAASPAQGFALAVTMWIISGFTYTFGNAPLNTILQTSIPHNMQGRVFSLFATLMGLAAPIGLSLLGPLGELVGVRGVFMMSGFLGALVCLCGLLSKDIFKLEHSKVNSPSSLHPPEPTPPTIH